MNHVEVHKEENKKEGVSSTPNMIETENKTQMNCKAKQEYKRKGNLKKKETLGSNTQKKITTKYKIEEPKAKRKKQNKEIDEKSKRTAKKTPTNQISAQQHTRGTKNSELGKQNCTNQVPRSIQTILSHKKRNDKNRTPIRETPNSYPKTTRKLEFNTSSISSSEKIPNKKHLTDAKKQNKKYRKRGNK